MAIFSVEGRIKMNYPHYNPDTSIKQPLRFRRCRYGWLGTYFVIIHAQGHAPIFNIPALHTLLEEIWRALPERFPNLTLDDFVIEPDHIRLIAHLTGHDEKATMLGRVIGTYKSLVAIAWLRYIDTVEIPAIALPSHIWQRNYHEHTICDALELEQVRQYIHDHPPKPKTPDTKNPL